MVEGTSCSGPGWMGITIWKGVVEGTSSGPGWMGIAMDLEMGG